MRGLMYKNFLLFRIELAVVGVLQLFISATVLLTTLAEINTPQGTLLLYGCMFIILSFIESGLFAPDEKPSARSCWASRSQPSGRSSCWAARRRSSTASTGRPWRR